MLLTTTLAFGPLLKHLRKQAGMTQRDLAAALGYSESFISCLEKAHRQPDLQAVTERFIPALGLQDDPKTAAALIEQTALARGERPPAAVTFQRTTQTRIEEAHTADYAPPPALPTELIGRAAEINQLCNRLLGHRGRLLTLVGPPGIGKTTLALAIANRLHFHYQDGVVFVPLAAVSDQTLMASTILTAVGNTDLSPPQAKLIAFLRRKTMLLVLDNLEQISAAAALIADLVAACPGLCILATSRERLHLRAEQRCKVPPLDLAPAVELFVQRAQAVNAEFVLTPHNQPTLAAICQRLDCLPLAIELCAAQIDLLAPAQLLVQLQDHRLDLLVDGARDLPPRQRTLRSAIGYSYALLDEVERLLFRHLGVFAGGFALAAAEALAADRLAAAAVQSTLHALIGKSLVRAEGTPTSTPRFRLLETIREFALEQLTANGETEQVRQRHADYFRGHVAQNTPGLAGQAASRQLDQLERDHDNLRLALQWLLAHDALAAQGLVGELCDFWYIRGHFGEGRRWAKAALAASHLAARQRAAALYTGSRLAFTVDDLDDALGLSQESLTIYRQLGDAHGIATVSHDAGWIAYQLGRYAEAHLIFDENVVACRRLGDKQKLARALNSSATSYVLDGVVEQYGLARRHFAENLALAQAIDWQEGVAYAWQGHAMLEQKLGNYQQAILHLEQALAIFRMLGFQRNEALILRGIGEAARLDQQLNLAQARAEAALHLYQQLQVPWGIMATTVELGMIARVTGNWAEAEKQHRQSLQIAQAQNDLKTVAVNLASLSGVWLAQDQPQAAAQGIAVAQQLFDRLPAFLPPGDAADFGQLQADLRATLGEAQFALAWQQGEQTEVDAMIRSVLDV